MRVVTVDDQAPFREAARAVLERAPTFEVVGEAESGEEAVEMVASLQPDLVLMDINMGGISGIEATRRIIEANPSVVVFLLSTYQEEDLPPDVSTCGASAYLHKEDFGGRALRKLWEDGGTPGWRQRAS